MFILDFPVDRHERWALLDKLIQHWFPGRRSEHGVDRLDLDAAEQRLGLALPAALREWCERYGARNDIWSTQDRLLPPSELWVEDDVLVFCVEAQNCVRWGMRLADLTLDDPPVLLSDRDEAKSWLVESPTTSAFATQFALLSVKFSGARYTANGQGTDAAFAAIERSYHRMPFPDMHWPPCPTRFYGDDEIVVETDADTWIWAAARSRAALAQLDALVREAGMDGWESYED